MSSAAQLAANQANATHSTGPVSETGKTASSRNHLRHGFRPQTVLLTCVTGHDPAEYQALLADLTQHLAPQDLTDTRFVREMADAESTRAKLALLGFEAAISDRNSDSGVLHRVRVGPYNQVETMNKARAKLLDSGVDVAIVRNQK